VAYVRALLRQIGARWGRPRPIVACPWKAARRQRRIAEIRRLVLTPGNNAKRYLIIRKSRATRAWLPEFSTKIRLHFLSPYCPKENRIERSWLALHAKVTRNHRQKTIHLLLTRVHGYLAERFETRRQVLLID
jgi:transposase